MPEPVTLAVLGGVALTEGVKFLYAQAGEAIKRHYENKKAAQQAATIPSEGKIPDAIEAPSNALTIHTDELEKTLPRLTELRSELNLYGDGTLPVENSSSAMLKAADELRGLLESIYQQPLNFRGEQRNPPHFDVVARADIDTNHGPATALRLGENDRRTYKIDTHIGENAETGEFTLVDATQTKNL